jgi:geranylgeranyl diphosphate synthase type II
MELAAAVDQINEAFRDYALDQRPAALYQPIHYMLNRDSDRFYPLLTLWSCYLFSGAYQKAIVPCLGVEVFYNFFLVHSDLLDENPEPRDGERIHEKWNKNVAILSGDAMIFKAYEFLIEVAPEQIKPVISNFNQCFTRICEGKQLALSHPDTKNDLETLHLNPGALGEFSMLLGALIGGASLEQQAQVGRLGIDIAIDKAHSASQSLEELNLPEPRIQEFTQWLKNHS